MTAAAASKGDLFERRVARLLFAEGCFVRRRVDLQAAYAERFQITDLDVVGFRFSPTLGVDLISGECKTTEAKSAPSALDLLLRNVGVARLIGARTMLLATHRPLSARVRTLARQLGAEVLDPTDLERREAIAGITGDRGFGSHEPAFAEVERKVATAVKREPELQRVHAFARSELWLGDPFAALKRAIASTRYLGRGWGETLPDSERSTLEWLLRECLVGMTLAVTRVAGLAFRQSHEAFVSDVQRRLAEGIASFETLERVSREVDRYVMAVLRDAGVDPARQVASLGAFMPAPPPYTDTLIEVIERFAAAPHAAADAARVADWHIARTTAAGATDATQPRFVDEDESLRLIRLIRTFLASQAEAPAELFGIGDTAPIAPPAVSGANAASATPGQKPGDGGSKLFE